MHDDRLKERLYAISQDFYNSPELNIAEASGSKARTIGAYRFFKNRKLSMDVILTAHTEAAIERIKEHRVVLAPQDMTTLDYSTHPMTQGLGPVGNHQNGALGLTLHDTLAFTPEGTPLGVLDAQCWSRDPAVKGKKHQRHVLPIEQKESMKWLRSYRRVAEIQRLCPETTLVSMGDREADIYELFAEALKDSQGPKLLVRSEKTRRRKVEGTLLWDHMAGQDVRFSLPLHVPRSGSRAARETVVDVRHAAVEIAAPVAHKSKAPLKVWAVYLVEPAAPANAAPIEWMLLTTASVETDADAQERIEWYCMRWGIEVYHRTLKSGCRLKDRQLGGADRLEVCLGIDIVVAWRIYHMAMLGREMPDASCTIFFRDEEWKALCCYVDKTPIPPETPPTMEEAVRMVGRIGGHLGRKSDGMPGTQTLWRGILRLETATEMYMIFQQHSPHPQQSGP